jgi:deoxyribodipyrimidine photolyase-related protein
MTWAKEKKIALIYPNQLFEDHPALTMTKDICLVENDRFFKDFKFHKKKLLFHRASMLAYKKELVSRGYRITHVRQGAADTKIYLTELMSKKRLEDVYAADPSDQKLMLNLQKLCRQHQKRLHILGSPSFLTPNEVLEDFFNKRKNFSMTSFYIQQRKRLDILVRSGKPVGGKWSFDPKNRKKLPQHLYVPGPKTPETTPSKSLASEINKEYEENPGIVDEFIFPVTRRDSRRWLKDFIENRLKYFGDYEDSISTQNVFVFHSVLSPLLNVGLLTPKEVLDQVLLAAEYNKIPINSLEGFVRQIIGWREFIRGAYISMSEKQRKSNFWDCSNKLSKAFYDGTTGIEPVDTIIKRVVHYSYCHHIERLMILGNFMLLCEIHPDEVYRWFMELFIDAFDWVMVPNVYGMSQYADGGLITSKPYISSSNYIKKMSDFGTGPWCSIWDALFWRFIQKHEKVFADNARMRVMTFQLKRMGKKKVKEHVKAAERYLIRL